MRWLASGPAKRAPAGDKGNSVTSMFVVFHLPSTPQLVILEVKELQTPDSKWLIHSTRNHEKRWAVATPLSGLQVTRIHMLIISNSHHLSKLRIMNHGSMIYANSLFNMGGQSDLEPPTLHLRCSAQHLGLRCKRFGTWWKKPSGNLVSPR